MIDNNEFDTFDINYIELDWILEKKKLVVTTQQEKILLINELYFCCKFH